MKEKLVNKRNVIRIGKTSEQKMQKDPGDQYEDIVS